MTKLASFAVAVAAVLALGRPAVAGPIGSSAADAAYSAMQLLTVNPAASSGFYWFDPDGAGGQSAFVAYADMTTDGGGWMLVRHVAGSGGWISVADNLQGTQSLNAGLSGTMNSNSSWSLNYSAYTGGTGEFMFKTGDSASWGVLSYGSVFAQNSNLFSLNAQVLASSGVGVAAGGSTNVLNRSEFAEDPWIGFEGNHFQNINRMMYGEAGWGNGTDQHSMYKNLHLGVNVFIREAVTPPFTQTAVPVPGALALLGLGLIGLGGISRKPKAA